MNKKFAKFIIFLFTVLLMGVFGGLYSLIFAGLASGSMIGIAPKFSFELVGRYVCPDGSQLQYLNSSNAPTSEPYLVNCVAQDGTVTQGMKSKAISTVIGMYFLICFIPTYIPGAILLWIFLNRQLFDFLDEDPATGNVNLLAENK